MPESVPTPSTGLITTPFFQEEGAGKQVFECAPSLRVCPKSCERPKLMWAALPFSLLCRTNARVVRSVKFVSYGYTDNATGEKMRKGNGTTNQKKPSYFLFKVFSHVILDWSWDYQDNNSCQWITSKQQTLTRTHTQNILCHTAEFCLWTFWHRLIYTVKLADPPSFHSSTAAGYYGRRNN